MPQRHVAAVVLSIAAACGGPDVRATVVPGARAASLAFRVESADPKARAALVEAITVAGDGGGRRGGRTAWPTYWFVARRPGAPGLPLPAVVRFGAAPTGYTATRPPAVLPPGRYQVDVLAGGRHSVARFAVTTTGAVE